MRDFSLKFLSNLGRDTRPRKLKFCPVLSCPVPSRLVLAVVGQIRVSVEITNCSQNRTEQNNSKKKKNTRELLLFFIRSDSFISHYSPNHLYQRNTTRRYFSNISFDITYNHSIHRTRTLSIWDIGIQNIINRNTVIFRFFFSFFFLPLAPITKKKKTSQKNKKRVTGQTTNTPKIEWCIFEGIVNGVGQCRTGNVNHWSLSHSLFLLFPTPGIIN